MSTILFDIGNAEEVIAGYTTDSGGLFRYHHPEDLAHFESVGQAFGLSANRMVRVRQRHTDFVLPVDASNGGEGIVAEGPEDPYDAMVTNTPRLMLCIIAADCVPVFLYDAVSKAIGLVHSGRFGTSQEIALKAVSKMQQLYGTRPENIRCILGPSLCAEHHQVGVEHLAPFSERFSASDQQKFITVSGSHGYIDMGAAIELTLTRAGVQPSNIFNCDVCTYEQPDLFSMRRGKNLNANILSFITLKG